MLSICLDILSKYYFYTTFYISHKTLMYYVIGKSNSLISIIFLFKILIILSNMCGTYSISYIHGC